MTTRVSFIEKDDEDDLASQEEEENELGDLPTTSWSISNIEYSHTLHVPINPKKLLNDTFDMLNKPVTNMSEEDGMALFLNIQILGKQKYSNKTALGQANAMSKLLALFSKYNENSILVMEACSALIQMTQNDCDNKRLLGSENACKELVDVIIIHNDKLDVLELCFQLAINLCNATFQYKVPGVTPLHRTSTVINSLDYHTCNNRINLMNAGLCVLLYDTMKVMLSNSLTLSNNNNITTGQTKHPNESFILVVCKLVAILAENDLVSKTLGDAGICEIITKLLTLTKQIDIILSASYALIILCSDNKAGNKQKFSQFGILEIIITNLKEYTHKVGKYKQLTEFNLLIERMCWCLVNLTASCPRNMVDLKNNTNIKELLEYVISSTDLREGAKQKATAVFKRIFT